jgi:iron complex outermembrane receptor protein
MSMSNRTLQRALCAAAALPMAWAQVLAAEDSAGQPVGQSGKLEEVIVTAERRSSDIQKSSLAIAAFNAEAITRAGLTQIQDLSNLLPGVNISLEGAQTQVYIRGVGTFAANSLADAAVAINVDQVNIARPSGVGALFYDVSRVEVLKGPQGTLYGRNASGGAVNVITNNPSFTEFSGDASLSVGNYSAVTAAGALNMPLSDKLALRAAFQYSRHDGYLSDGTNDEDQRAMRLKALWQATDDLSILLSGDYAKIGGNGAGAANYPPINSDDPWIGQSDARSNAIKVAGTSTFLQTALRLPPAVAAALATQAANTGNDFMDYHPWGVSADVEWDLGFATLSVIPAFRRNDGTYLTHSGSFYFLVDEKDRTASVETRLGGDTGPVSWTVGAFYFDEHQEYTSLADTNPVSTSFSDVPLLDDENWALFGQATYSFTDALRLIGGARYTDERKDFAGSGYATSGSSPPVPRTFAGSRSWTSTNWKAGLEYDLAAQSMLYATASTGFKAGGFGTAGSAVVPYDPEKLKAYAVGSKNRFFDDTLQLNLELFYWDYIDHQEPHLSPSPVGGGVAFYTTNAGRATIKGVNLSVLSQLTRADTVRLDVEYNQSRYDSFTYDANVGFANSLNTGCGIGPAHTIAIGSVSVPVNTIDCSGFELTKAPKWSGTFGYEHVFSLDGGAAVSAEVTTRASSRTWGAVDFIANERLPSFTQTNLSLSYTPPSQAFTVTAFGRNLENSNIYTNAFQAQFVPGLVAASILAPRTYGARFAVRF